MNENLPFCEITVKLFDPMGKYIRARKGAFEFNNENFKTNYEITCAQILWHLATELEDKENE